MNWLWLPLALTAYGIFAITGIVDKIIVSHKIKNPLVVSFWVSLSGIPSAVILLLGLLPLPFAEAFRFDMPAAGSLVLITVTGMVLQLGLMVSYAALMRGEATRVASIIGAATPAFALVFAWGILHERLSVLSYAAFIVLLAGAMLMLVRRGKRMGLAFWLAILSAALGALQSVLAKAIYEHNHFISSVALMGLGNVVYCLMLLILIPSVRQAVFQRRKGLKAAKKIKQVSGWSGFWVLFNAVVGGVGVIVLNLALKFGPVSLVNALKGVQYIGIFIMALVLARNYPRLLEEEMSAQSMGQKLVAIVVIAIGLVLVVLG